MSDGDKHSPSRDNRDEDQSKFFREMVIGQERMAQVLQTLTIMVESMNPQDRQN